MQAQVSTQPDLDIIQWRQDVADAIPTLRPQTSRADTSSPRKLRSGRRLPHSGLVEVSGNRQKLHPCAQARNPSISNSTRKHKREMSANPFYRQKRTSRGVPTTRGGRRRDEDEDELQRVDEPRSSEAPQGRGRPPNKRGLGRGGSTTTVPIKDHSPRPSSSAASTRSSSRSRKKKTFDQPPSIAAINLRVLETCDPPVKQRMPPRVIAEYSFIPKETQDLLDRLDEIPYAVIPANLRPSYETDAATPRKTRKPPLPREYMQSDEMPYPPSDLQHLKRRIDRSLRQASWNHMKEVHERQWGVVVHSLLAELELWPSAEAVLVLNTETCAINPEELHTVMSTGQLLTLDQDLGSSKAGTTKVDGTKEEEDPTISKMVDWCLGLELDENEHSIINEAFRQIRQNARSLNQSLSYIDTVPLFLDIEIKKTHQARNPEVQLAVWACAGLKKKRYMGWDSSLPMPGIVVQGHNWFYYLFVEISSDLIMIGPFLMGTTVTLIGVWQIVYRLNLLIEWGTTIYRQWFEDHIMAWAERLKRGGMTGGEETTKLDKGAESLSIKD
ncbi:MAG: hypothetical protein Q9201_006031 [Fulgogasparrea decipioides]